LSGNRNFEGRVNPGVRANYLASPPLVVVYALAGSMRKDVGREPLGEGKDGQPVYLKDVWPTSEEIAEIQRAVVSEEMFAKRYKDVLRGEKRGGGRAAAGGKPYAGDPSPPYGETPPYFAGMTMEPAPVKDIIEARVLGIFGDSITTDHISPAGS